MLYRSLRACDVFLRDRPRFTWRVRHRDMTWALCLLNFREEAFLGREFKSMLKEIYREFTVDIVEFVFVFSIVLVQIFLIHFLQVVEIVRAFGIHTFMEDKVFPVFLMPPELLPQ